MKGKVCIFVLMLAMILVTTASAYTSLPTVTNGNSSAKEHGITIKSAIGTNITYFDNGKITTMELPKTVRYYYNGTKQDYNNLKDILYVNTSIIFEYNEEGTSYQYATIIDPVYSKPEIAIKFNPSGNKLGSIKFEKGTPIVKGGDLITSSQIAENDVVYEISDNWGKNKYILVLANRVEGKIEDIIPNKLSPKKIRVDNGTYELSEDLDFNKINDSSGAFKVGEMVTAVFSYDGKVVGLTKLNYRTEPYTECIILDDASSSDKLTNTQVLTSNGLFYKLSNLKLELGKKYEIVIDEDRIVNVGSNLNQTEKIIVDSILGMKIFYRDKDIVKNMRLPQKPKYYYKGTAIDYEELKNIIQVNTSIIFAYNQDKTDYEYAVVIGPVYSKAEIVSDYKIEGDILGSITFQENVPIVKESNGDLIDTSQIAYQDVVYKVSDIFNKNHYILVVSRKVSGTIRSILPSRLSPNIITLTNGQSYEISEDIEYSKLRGDSINFKVGYPITLLLGYDGKVIDIY